MKDKTLLILAAGMGSRFGGLKQVEPVGPNGESILEYSIYDAIRNGFNKVVFIIKEENYDLFRERFGKKIEKQIHTEYVFQNLDNIPKGYEIPSERTKPLGTAHAILCAKNKINEPFVIINADDFYGVDAYKAISNFIDKNDNKDLGLVGYNVINTITENGSVKRGLCNIENNELKGIDESTIELVNGELIATSLITGKTHKIDKNDKVSMNMILFYPDFFDYIEKNFEDFLTNSNILKDEYLIPTVVGKGIKENLYNVKIIDTNAKWVGVTYREDKESVVDYINDQIKLKRYPNNLWK